MLELRRTKIVRLSSTPAQTLTSAREEASQNSSQASRLRSSNLLEPLCVRDILFPRTVQRNIREGNERCFNVFIEFPKPIIAAVNGPGIGAGTTAPALCDVVIASEKATFSTPFTNLGVGPEGCASVHLERILGRENASRMLDDCWRPSAQVLFSNTVIVSLAGPFLGSQADRSGI